MVLPFGRPAGRIDDLEPYLVQLTYQDIRESIKKQSYLSARSGYIFFQPGDEHDIQVLRWAYQDLIIRIGDLHHLSNPVTKSIQFLDQLKNFNLKIYLNTNPSLAPFFQRLYPNVNPLPISEITIHNEIVGRAKRLNIDKPEGCSHPKIAYIGNQVSPYHPRRTFIVNYLIKNNSNVQIDLLPQLGPVDWLLACAEYDVIIAPTLNAQWSHNLFVPNLAGATVVTDCQAMPTYSYYTSVTTKNLRPIHYLLSPQAMIKNITKLQPLCSKTRRKISAHACANMESCLATAREVYEFPSANSSLTYRYSQHLNPAACQTMLRILANIFEILQEVIRVFVSKTAIVVNCDSLEICHELAACFPHPRIFYVFTKPEYPTNSGILSIMVESLPHEGGLGLLKILLDVRDLTCNSAAMSGRYFNPAAMASFSSEINLLQGVACNYTPALFRQELSNAVTVNYF